MALVNMRDMLQHAYMQKYAVGAFDLVSIEFLEAIIQAAERCRSPVILSLAESHFDYFNFEMIMPAVVNAAKQASVPVAIHLDHGECISSVSRAINLGCNGVMLDASQHALEENIRITAEVVAIARGCGIPVEGELGYVPGVEGEDAERHPGEIAYTTVSEAEQYVKQTGVDCLAVSIGTVHGRMKGEPKLDIASLAEINQALKIPLVIHGGTGLSDEQFRALINNGVAKINYYTALADAAGRCMQVNIEQGSAQGYTSIVKGVREEIAAEVEKCMKLWGCAYRADEVMAVAESWEPVEHLIIYNVSGAGESEIEAMMQEGKRVLSTIPGVLEVLSGSAVQQQAGYRYSWLIRFCHAAVINSYRDHPEHVAFADRLFRPIAGDRISIDYQVIQA